MSDFIPEDVVVHILTRLPTKSLIRLRCVCKLWDSLITSPTFINSHLNESLTNPKNSYDNLPLVIVSFNDFVFDSGRSEHYRLFIDTGDVENPFNHEYLIIPFPRPHLEFYHLVGYVKGLFCVQEWDHNYFLCNPSIRKSISLPHPLENSTLKKDMSGSLTEYLGFGFDSRSNDYKVVRVTILYRTKPSETAEVLLVEVYSVNAGSWKVSTRACNSFPPGCLLNFSRKPSTCLEGGIHWVAVHITGGLYEQFVLSFDLSDEVFKTISMPNELAKARIHIRTFIVGGFLSLVCEDSFDVSDQPCSIWIMKEYGVVDSWYKYMHIDITGGVRAVLGMQKNGHILLEQGIQSWEEEVCSYDPRNKEVKRLGIHGTHDHKIHFETYEENLILLDKPDPEVS